MCRKLYIECWTPTDINDPSLESRVKQGQLTEADNPFAKISRITYFECNDNPRQTHYFRRPACKDVTQGGRQGQIRSFCSGDDHCQVRIHSSRSGYDDARKQLDKARRFHLPVNSSAKEVVEWERYCEEKLGAWRYVFEEHRLCPARRCGDPMICMLVNHDAMDRPLEMWPDQRMGQDPSLERVR